jgi:hypothetical protein
MKRDIIDAHLETKTHFGCFKSRVGEDFLCWFFYLWTMTTVLSILVAFLWGQMSWAGRKCLVGMVPFLIPSHHWWGWLTPGICSLLLYCPPCTLPPFASIIFSERVSCFLLRPASNQSFYLCLLEEEPGFQKCAHAQLVLWDRALLTNFCPGWPWTTILSLPPK